MGAVTRPRRLTLIPITAIGALAAVLASCGTNTTNTTTTMSHHSGTTVPFAGPAACWPSSPEGFETPTIAADRFVGDVLGVNPRTGVFQPTDDNHGTIDVYIGEELPSVPDTAKGTLSIKRFDSRGWFVTAATSGHVTIATPASGSRITGGSLRISGNARGFEGQVSISVFTPSPATSTGPPRIVARTSVIAGSQGVSEPYDATVDVPTFSDAGVLCVIVRGGRGLEQDPGEFAMIPVLVGDES